MLDWRKTVRAFYPRRVFFFGKHDIGGCHVVVCDCVDIIAVDSLIISLVRLEVNNMVFEIKSQVLITELRLSFSAKAII